IEGHGEYPENNESDSNGFAALQHCKPLQAAIPPERLSSKPKTKSVFANIYAEAPRPDAQPLPLPDGSSNPQKVRPR
ncbi:hypothetical protein, partial [Zoogloea sp.]|uniref:hypothetical protein n=1 Tax=Zoogloea sp. TaxID=49181 RepID=UPI0025D5B070